MLFAQSRSFVGLDGRSRIEKMLMKSRENIRINFLL